MRRNSTALRRCLHIVVAIIIISNIILSDNLQFLHNKIAVAKASTEGSVLQKNTLQNTGDDAERITFLFLGDGFTASEQTLFDQKAKEIEDYLCNSSPLDEFLDVMNFYSLNVISKESGGSDNPEELKDTYFQCTYNYGGGPERLLAPVNSNAARKLSKEYVPDADFVIMIVNDTRYGGAGGGFIATTSINDKSYEIILHELGHTIGGLVDEYATGSGHTEGPNVTQESDPSKIKWKDFIGVNGVDIYPFEDDPTWFRPHQSCKMQMLGIEYPFCEVCKETLRKKLAERTWMAGDIRNISDFFRKVEISPYRKTLYLGGTVDNSVQVEIKLPALLKKVKKFSTSVIDGSNLEVTVQYATDNPKIASVTENGLITATGTGTTVIYITCSFTDGTSVVWEIPITVVKAQIRIVAGKEWIKLGTTTTYKAEVIGYSLSDIVWSTTKKKGIEIDKKTGKAKAVSVGNDIVVARVGNTKATMQVTIVK